VARLLVWTRMEVVVTNGSSDETRDQQRKMRRVGFWWSDISSGAAMIDQVKNLLGMKFCVMEETPASHGNQLMA